MAHKLSPGEVVSLVLKAIRNPEMRERICRRQHLTEREFEKWQSKFIRAGTKALEPEVSKRGRSYTRDEKLDMVFAGLRHAENRNRLLSEHHVTPKTYYRWRDDFVAAGKLAFDRGALRTNPVATLIVTTIALLAGLTIFILMSTKGASCLLDVKRISSNVPQIKKIDVNTLQIYYKPFADWERIRSPRDNTYRNPDTDEYTLVAIQRCPACDADIPVPVVPRNLKLEDPAALREIMMKQVCPKCRAKIGK